MLNTNKDNIVEIDRYNRDKVANFLEKFIHQEIDNFELDDVIFEIDSNDKLLNWSIQQIWSFYDDFSEHKASLSREEYNYLYRLILLLKSNCTIKEYTKKGDIDLSIYPFNSKKEIFKIRRKIKYFKKLPYNHNKYDIEREPTFFDYYHKFIYIAFFPIAIFFELLNIFFSLFKKNRIKIKCTE